MTEFLGVKITFIQKDSQGKTFTRKMNQMGIGAAIQLLTLAQKQRNNIFTKEIEGYDKPKKES